MYLLKLEWIYNCRNEVESDRAFVVSDERKFLLSGYLGISDPYTTTHRYILLIRQCTLSLSHTHTHTHTYTHTNTLSLIHKHTISLSLKHTQMFMQHILL